jgi:lysophospholipase L1-like esterase
MSDKQNKAARWSPERERALKRLSVIIGLAFLFLIAEVGLRMYAKVSAYLPKTYEYMTDHRYLATALIPGSSFANGIAKVSVNSRGFRGPEFAVPKESGTYRIFALGGSTTFGHFPSTSADDKTYPAQLDALLKKDDREGRKYEVINSGVPGYSARTSVSDFQARTLFYQPDMVLIYHHINDINRYGNEENLSKPLVNQYIYHGVWTGIFDNVLGWSYVVQELRFVFDWRLRILFDRMFGGKNDGPKETAEGKPWKLDQRYVEAFRRDMNNLVVLAKANHVVPVLLSMSLALTEKTNFANFTPDEIAMQLHKPVYFYETVPPEQRFKVQALYNQVVKEVAEQNGALYIDVDAGIPKTSEFHADICHLTDKGSALQAEIVYKALKKAGY